AAICGGVFLQMSPFMWSVESTIRPRFNAYMNPKGRCFSFDQAALKPYAEKVDNQLLVVDAPCIGGIMSHGADMRNNGRSAGLAAPSGPAEQEAIADCVRHAGISPLDVDAMESAGSCLEGDRKGYECPLFKRF
ncbi:orfB, partial [Symbiodinium sp. KB8]